MRSFEEKKCDTVSLNKHENLIFSFNNIFKNTTFAHKVKSQL